MDNWIVSEESKPLTNLCLCGCKQPVTYNKYNPRKYIHGHNAKGYTNPRYGKGLNGEQNPKWKGGRRIIQGYMEILCKDHPYANKHGYVREHRLIMENHLGRYLKPTEIVHHKDHDKLNNSINNLELFSSKAEHSRMHRYLRNKRSSV